MLNRSPKSKTFEQAVKRLEEIVSDLENGQLGLEDSLKRYEEGIGLIRVCGQQLKDAEQKIQLLQKKSGQLVLEDWDPQTHESGGTAAGTPSARRKRAKQKNAADSDRAEKFLL